MFNTLDKIWRLSKDAIGDVIVKYLDPINIDDYLKVNGPASEQMLIPKNFESTALQLTTHLLKKQNIETPITLNSLISAWLL